MPESETRLHKIATWRGWEEIAYGVPWALLLMFIIAGYVVVELITGGLTPSKGVGAIVGIAGLAIGHGVHEHARHRD